MLVFILGGMSVVLALYALCASVGLFAGVLCCAGCSW